MTLLSLIPSHPFRSPLQLPKVIPEYHSSTSAPSHPLLFRSPQCFASCIQFLSSGTLYTNCSLTVFPPRWQNSFPHSSAPQDLHTRERDIAGHSRRKSKRIYQEGKGIELGKFLSTGPRFPRYHCKKEMLTLTRKLRKKKISSAQSCFESGLDGTVNERTWGNKHTRKLCAVGVNSAQ